MSDPFTEIATRLEKEGMTVEASTLKAVGHQATVVGTYYLQLKAMGVRPAHAFKLTVEWMALCSEPEDEDDE